MPVHTFKDIQTFISWEYLKLELYYETSLCKYSKYIIKQPKTMKIKWTVIFLTISSPEYKSHTTEIINNV